MKTRYGQKHNRWVANQDLDDKKLNSYLPSKQKSNANEYSFMSFGAN